MPSVRRTFFETYALCMVIYHFVRYLWRLNMSKTTSGIVLVAGIAVAVLARTIGASVQGMVPDDPSSDWMSTMVTVVSMAGILLGLGMFFFGAMKFARKEPV